MKKITYILFFFLCTVFICSASKIEKAYEALSIYDYFKAKKLAYSSIKKRKSLASFVLATIYSRTDNPFHNCDSAYKFIEMSNAFFDPIKDSKVLNKYSFHDSSLFSLRVQIHHAVYKKYIDNDKDIRIEDLERFIVSFPNCAFIGNVFLKRDSIAFYNAVQEKRSEAVKDFLQVYPETSYYNEALAQIDYFTFKEYSEKEDVERIENFISKYPLSKYVKAAEDLLFAIALKQRNTALLYKYIKTHPQNSHADGAWKDLFSIEVNSYSSNTLSEFITRYPDFPYKQSIEREIQLNAMQLILVKSNSAFGFINDRGDTIVSCVYDGLEEFSDGLAVAERNGKFGYINKLGEPIISFDLEDAESFKDGRAIIKRNGLYYVINRTGSVISAGYNGISDYNEGLAIVKTNDLYGAIDKNGKEEIALQYQGMTEFSSGLSVAQKDSKFGYVDARGLPTIPFMFQWAERFNNNRARVKYNNKYGVIDKKGDFVIAPAYDRIDEEINGIYIVYKNNLYGFADTSGCLLSQINNLQINNAKSADYTDGNLMRLSLEEEQRLINKNGKSVGEPEEYEEMYLPKEGLIKVFTEDKYGFVNIKNKIIIKPLYDYAEDFRDSLCVVEKKDLKIVINLKGDVLFSTKSNELERIDGRLFTYLNDKNQRIICNSKGTVLLTTNKDAPEIILNRFLIWEGNSKTDVYDLNQGKFIF